MTYKLYLDDIRNPTTPGPWVVVRSFIEATSFVLKHGFPQYVSFDHDLGDETAYTGYHFALWLVNLDMDNDSMPHDFAFNVHSANPVGAANIIGLLSAYMAKRLMGAPVSLEKAKLEAEEMFLAPSGEGRYAADWADKPHRVLYDAIKLIRSL